VLSWSKGLSSRCLDIKDRRARGGASVDAERGSRIASGQDDRSAATATYAKGLDVGLRRCSKQGQDEMMEDKVDKVDDRDACWPHPPIPSRSTSQVDVLS